VGFLEFFKILKFLDFYRTLSLRRQIVSAGSAGVGKLLAQAQPAACVDLFLAQAQPAYFFSVLTVFFSAGSAGVGNFLAQTQPA
jgi:hypothetical protein